MTFHGDRVRTEALELLSKNDVLLFPSYYEGFGLALIEAMAIGVVPIASKIRDVTDWIVRDGETGFTCEIGNTEQFASKIMLLGRDRGLLECMQRNASEDYRNRFTAEREAESYMGLFLSFLSTPDRKGDLSWDEYGYDSLKMSPLRRFVPRVAAHYYRRWVSR
jgi:glycosyltransferase involved in cell wall biosynthesis